MMQSALIGAAVLLAAMADLWTTQRVLAAGGRELNPLLRWCLQRGGFAALAGVKLAITGGCAWLAFAWGFPLVALILAALPGWAAWHNWRVLRTMGNQTKGS